MTTDSEMGAHPVEADAHPERNNTARSSDYFDRISSSLQETEFPILEGWAIFPCHSVSGGTCTCGSTSCTAKGKHPMTRHGVKDASRDPSQWQQWSTWGEANWAVACGRASSIFVIDLDPAKGGFDSWDEFEMNRRGDSLPDTLKSRTGGGGFHLYFQYPQHCEIRNRVGWMPGVDLRSDGGYVILPPGKHISGGRYEWMNWGTAIASAPADLLAALTHAKRRTGSGHDGSTGNEMPTLAWFLEHGFGRPGERDINAHRLACRLWRRYWDHPDLVEALMGEVWFVTDQSDHPFPWAVAAAKIGRAREFVAREIEREQDAGSRLFGGVL